MLKGYRRGLKCGEIIYKGIGRGITRQNNNFLKTSFLCSNYKQRGVLHI
jgi:hypothetical protein